MLTVKKRDGRIQNFNADKIITSLGKSRINTNTDYDEQLIHELEKEILGKIEQKTNQEINAEEIYDIVISVLTKHKVYSLLGAFIDYREQRDDERQGNSKLMRSISRIVKETTKDNANILNGPSAKMLQIGSEASKWYTLRNMPKHLAKAHTEGKLHFHDLDYYEKTINCLQIPLAKCLNEGFNAGRGYIRKPKRIGSATALAAILLQASQNDFYGGQSFSHFDRDMAQFVPIRYTELMERLSQDISEYEKRDILQDILNIRNDVYQAMEALVYNLNSMMSRAGAQAPFSSINLGTDTSVAGRLITEQLLKAHGAGLGNGETGLFPNIIFRVKKGINYSEGDPNYDLRKLAQVVACKRMNPTFSNMDMIINAKWGDEVSYMGCRTRVQANLNGPEVTDGRGNIGFVTMDLVAPAIEIDPVLDTPIKKKRYYKKIDKLLSLCEEHLLHRYRTVCQLKGKDVPFMMGQNLYVGAENVGSEDSIEEAIKNGTLSVGFIGLAEAMKQLYGNHHGESEEVWQEAYELIKYISDKVKEMATRNQLNFTTLATPAEGLSGRFIAIDKEKYGEIPWVTDKGFYSNSFHIPVDYEISIKDKLRLEGPFHALCDAGHISYVELKEAPWYNPDALEDIVNYGFDQGVGYMGVNFPIDECPSCYKVGLIVGDCECGVPDSNIKRIRRITGYLSASENFGEGKTAELKARVSHD